MRWWEMNRVRLVQTNLRETDAGLDPERLVRDLADMSANTLMMNTGGIVAFYPTALSHHWQNPYLRRADGSVRDLVGETVAACHRAGIRYIARFDFSKADESVFEAHPDWFYENAAGERMRFNGTVATCINGWYQREGALEILREVLERYPVDGVFFNMFGYQTRDYSGHSFGICRCGSCCAAFHDGTGSPLPPQHDPEHPSWAAYRRFQHQTTRRMLDRMRTLIKAVSPDIAISTYDEHGVDMVRKESNTELDRPLPVWLYQTSENVQSLEDAWQDKTVSNCCINAVGIDVRFMGVSPHLTAARLFGSLAAGSGLDFCIIGDFPEYPDTAGIAAATRVFRHAAAHEAEYGCFTSWAPVALVKPDRFSSQEAHDAYLGCFHAMKERHVLFDVLHAEHLAEGLRHAQSRLRAVLLPALTHLDPDAGTLLAALRRAGTHLVATGGVPSGIPSDAFPMTMAPDPIASRSAYLEIAGGLHPSFPAGKHVFLAGAVHPVRILPPPAGDGNPGWQIEWLWPILSAGPYGPPEKCLAHVRSHDHGAVIASRMPGEGASVLMPWQPDRLYLRHGYVEHRDLLVDLVAGLPGMPAPLETDAPSCVECFLHAHDAGGWMLQVINHSGFNGTTFEAPLPIRDIHVALTLPACGPSPSIRSLAAPDNAVAISRATVGGDVTRLVVRIRELVMYEGIRIEPMRRTPAGPPSAGRHRTDEAQSRRPSISEEASNR